MDQTSPTISPRRDAMADQAADVTQTAQEQAAEVATTTRDAVIDITSTATDQVAAVGADVKEQGRQLVGEAKQQAVTTADGQVAKVSGSITGFTEQITALLEGRPEEAGQVRDLASRAVQEVNTFAERLDQRGVQGIVDDVRTFARRRPGTFLLLAGAAGIGVGLVARGTSAAREPEGVQPSPPSGALPPSPQQQPTQPTQPSSVDDLPPLPPITPSTPVADPWARGGVR